jgi:hypothetical protein
VIGATVAVGCVNGDVGGGDGGGIEIFGGVSLFVRWLFCFEFWVLVLLSKRK